MKWVKNGSYIYKNVCLLAATVWVWAMLQTDTKETRENTSTGYLGKSDLLVVVVRRDKPKNISRKRAQETKREIFFWIFGKTTSQMLRCPHDHRLCAREGGKHRKGGT